MNPQNEPQDVTEEELVEWEKTVRQAHATSMVLDRSPPIALRLITALREARGLEESYGAVCVRLKKAEAKLAEIRAVAKTISPCSCPMLRSLREVIGE